MAEVHDRSFSEAARRLFPAYEISPSESLNKLRTDVALRRDLRDYVISSRDQPRYVCRSRMDAIVAFEFALARALAAAVPNNVHLHASGTLVGGRAVLALGKSGAGKSSLAASMLNRGHPTLGDDTVFLDASARAVPFKRLLKVSRELLGEFGVDPGATVHWDPDWPEVWLDPREGAGWSDPVPVGVIALARYNPAASLHISPVWAAEGLNALVSSVMVTGMGAEKGFDRLVHLVQDARVFRVQFPSAIEAAEALCALAT